MKKKKRPILEEYDKFEMGNASSMTECTGLIRCMATDEELEAYHEIYDYEGRPAVSDRAREDIKRHKNTI